VWPKVVDSLLSTETASGTAWKSASMKAAATSSARDWIITNEPVNSYTAWQEIVSACVNLASTYLAFGTLSGVNGRRFNHIALGNSLAEA
jgi:hypothetical protein